jgi:hypothetical protein
MNANTSTTELPVSTITSAIRAILRADEDVIGKGHPAARLANLRFALMDLEAKLPSRDPDAFETPNLDAFGYATVLGYLNEHDPLTLLMTHDPVQETIRLGRKATALCLQRGIKIVKVPACDHITQRYAKVTHVNAYPVAILAEVVFGEAA